MTELNFRSKEIQISFEAKSDFFVYADKNMINTVFRNIFTNAHKFTYRNGKVKIQLIDLGETVEVSIKDNGIGISQENLEKIFKPRYNYSTKGTLNESGTGLGLVICKEFIELNKRQISVESVLGQGTNVKFLLQKNN